MATLAVFKTPSTKQHHSSKSDTYTGPRCSDEWVSKPITENRTTQVTNTASFADSILCYSLGCLPQLSSSPEPSLKCLLLPFSQCQNHLIEILLARVQPSFIVPNWSVYKDQNAESSWKPTVPISVLLRPPSSSVENTWLLLLSPQTQETQKYKTDFHYLVSRNFRVKCIFFSLKRMANSNNVNLQLL